MRASGPISDR